MSAPGYTTGLRAETFENLQLNAGVLIKNLSLTGVTDAAALKSAIATALADDTKVIGATRGGGTFTVTREMRTPEIDGMRYPFVGGNFVDSVDANLTATLVEITPENIKLSLGSADVTTSGQVTTIKMHTAIEETDYIESIAWIGDISDGRYVVIVLKNALNTADFSLTFSDKSEGTIPLELHAHQANVDDYDEAPYEIKFFDKAVSSGTGTGTGTGT